jgi:hypothetical protein
MAFSNRKSNNQEQDQADWKASGFVNIYLPTQNGGEFKLGAVPLKDSVANAKTLREWLEASPENIEKLIPKIRFEYRSATPKEGSGIALD